MPKQTFFNLSEEKQKTLIAAGKKEFSRVPLDKASISNIIKTAKIPRGSFYQYFEDKEDLFFYILDGFSIEVRNQLTISLKQSGGDLFYAFEEMFKSFLIHVKGKEYQKFFKNACLNMSHRIEKTFTPNLTKERAEQDLESFTRLIDIEKLNIINKEEIKHIIQILVAITIHNMIQSFTKERNIEEALEIYNIEINMIKRGIYKGD